MTYTIEATTHNGTIVRCQGLRDTDNIGASAARCQASGLFSAIWIYACIDGRRVRGLRYDTGFTFR